MLLFSYYINNKIDKAWFDSSNVLYAECIESDTEYKTVKVVFKNGKQYEYKNVLVYDWSLFKNSQSQGKKLNEIFIKGKHEYEKLDDVNVEELTEELYFRINDGYTLSIANNELSLLDNKDDIKYTMPKPDDDTVNHIKGMLESINKKVRIIKEDE